MRDELVSVLIPCFNAQQYVADTLESVLSQTWDAIEIIVVDDGSTDGSKDVVRGFADRGVRLITQKRSGASAARNRAVAEARGSLVQFLDADDLLDPEKIERQVTRLVGRGDCVAVGRWGRFYRSRDEVAFEADEAAEDLSPVEWLLRAQSNGLGMFLPARWLIPRLVAETAGPWDESLSLNDDGEYFTRAVLASEKVLFCPDARCRYRSGVAGSLSSSRRWDSAFSSVALCEAHVLSREDSDRSRRVYALAWQHLAHACYPYAPEMAEEALGRARALHPVTIRPGGGWRFKVLSSLVGWRTARRLQMVSGRT